MPALTCMSTIEQNEESCFSELERWNDKKDTYQVSLKIFKKRVFS